MHMRGYLSITDVVCYLTDSCVGSPCEHKGLCRTVRQSGGRTNVTCHCRSGYYGNKCEQGRYYTHTFVISL